MKIKSLKLANAIRVGSELPAESFFAHDKGFDMELMPGGNIIKIVTPSGKSKVFTTIFNVFYFDLVDEPADTSKKARVKDAEAAVN